MMLLNECLLLFISLSTQSGNFWIHPHISGTGNKMGKMFGHPWRQIQKKSVCDASSSASIVGAGLVQLI
jgi:hypothetical protein